MVDARGLSCPEPVIMVKKFLKNNNRPSDVDVRVDNIASKENVTRYLEAMGYKVDTVKEDDGWSLKASL